MMNIERKAIPIMEGLWQMEADDKPHLMGSRCRECGEMFFPRKTLNFCMHCHNESLVEILFSGKGRVLMLTKVERQPAGGFYKGKVPYTYGIVQLDEGINIFSQLVDDPTLSADERVEMVVVKLYEEDENDVMTFKFKADSTLREGVRDDG
ncbi:MULTISPECIES: Zn-ribbon domain-containing OB-fold protein [unclassified Sporosarcina]|uniref:Zn-ribbon domain-containing OB-fold protein n=1 Tax=unclassified Sporosarcina TaxID=2647733 RepID=UPI000A19D1DD|nr:MULTISPECIES: OB-fold domain-containing protein [unclassified Sporosarcina]PID17629.1 transcriptional regulator [Sporosarcina sp. P35]